MERGRSKTEIVFPEIGDKRKPHLQGKVSTPQVAQEANLKSQGTVPEKGIKDKYMQEGMRNLQQDQKVAGRSQQPNQAAQKEAANTRTPAQHQATMQQQREAKKQTGRSQEKGLIAKAGQAIERGRAKASQYVKQQRQKAQQRAKAKQQARTQTKGQGRGR